MRAMLAGAAELLDFGPELLADLKTTVSEACNNVIIHAYPGGVGPMIVLMRANPSTVEVRVIDEGEGLRTATQDEDDPGLGLAVINALADETQVHGEPGRGTEVWMRFARSGSGGAVDMSQPMASIPEAPAQVAGDVVMSVSPVALLPGILGRVAGCLAAEAHFSIDRYADLYLVTDGISAHVRSYASDTRISAALAAKSRQLDLSVGPLKAGAVAALQSAGISASPMLLALLVATVAAEAGEDSETVRIMLIDNHRQVAESD